MTLKRIIAAILTIFMVSNIYIVSYADDELAQIAYRCSFDIELTKDFAEHPMYNYSRKGVLHVEAMRIYATDSDYIITFGSGSKAVSTYLRTRNYSGQWAQRGEYAVPATMRLIEWNEIVKKDGGEYLSGLSYPDKTVYGKSYLNCALDMAEDTSGLTIRMYLFSSNKVSASGSILPLSEVVSYLPDTFEETIFEENVDKGDSGRLLFKKNGVWDSAPKGSDEADKLDKNYEELKNQGKNPAEDNDYKNDTKDKNNNTKDEKTDDKTDSENDKNDENKEDEKLPSEASVVYDVFEPENGVVIKEKDIHGKRKEYKPELLETIKFNITYKLTSRYKSTSQQDAEKIVFNELFGKIGDEGDTIDVEFKHYSGEGKVHIFTYKFVGSKGTAVYWEVLSVEYQRYRSEWGVTSMVTDYDTPINGFLFSSSSCIKNGKAYSIRYNGGGRFFEVRGAVENNKVTDVKLEYYDEFAEFTTLPGIQYIAENEAAETDGGDFFLKKLSIEAGSTTASPDGVPERYWGLTKEESIEKYGTYYDKEGVRHEPVDLKVTKDELRFNDSDDEIREKIEIRVPRSLKGVSDNNETIFEITLFEGYTYSLLRVSGNLGEKYYMEGSSVWSNAKPAGVLYADSHDEVLLKRPSDYQSYRGWWELKKVDGEWCSVGSSDSGAMSANFSDSARTGIESLDFDFCGETLQCRLSDLDYMGALLNYFYFGALQDDSGEAAKELGLLPKDLEGVRQKCK